MGYDALQNMYDRPGGLREEDIGSTIKRLSIVLLAALVVIVVGVMAFQGPSPEARQAIQDLSSDDRQVRREAAETLGEIGPERGVVPALIQASKLKSVARERQ